LCPLWFAVLVSRTKLKVHGIAPLALPLAAPLKSRIPKNPNHSTIHVSGRPLRIARRIQIDRNPPSVGRELTCSPLRPERKTSPEGPDLVLDSFRLYPPEDFTKHFRHPLVTSHLVH